MVIRLWQYQTKAENAKLFEEFEERYGLPMMLTQPGCQEVNFLRKRTNQVDGSDIAEYSLISKWQNWDLLETALASKTWKDEIELFLAQGFGEGNGIVMHYDLISDNK